MALSKTWHWVCNVVLDNSTAQKAAHNFLWAWKAALMGQLTYVDSAGAAAASPGGLWTLYASSDGVTAGIDSTDRWGSSFDTTKLVRASAGSAHSWVVLKSPANFHAAGFVYLTLDYSTASDQNVSALISFNAPTGGSITARPTATLESANTANSSAGKQMTENSTSSQRFHCAIATDGAWFVLGNRIGASFFYKAAVCEVLTPQVSGDLFLAHLADDYNASAPGAFSYSFLTALSTGGAYAATIFSGGGTAPVDLRCTGNAYMTTNSATLGWRTAKWATDTIQWFVQLANYYDIKGASIDWLLTQSAIPTPGPWYFPDSINPERILVGATLVPWPKVAIQF